MGGVVSLTQRRRGRGEAQRKKKREEEERRKKKRKEKEKRKNEERDRFGERNVDMHENEISEKVIGAAIEVHRVLGPGLLESVYEEALCYEMSLMGLEYVRQQRVPVIYKGVQLKTNLRLDLLVEEKVIVELKARELLSPIDKPQLLTYLRLRKKHLGLILNFHVKILKEGIYRVVNNLSEPK